MSCPNIDVTSMVFAGLYEIVTRIFSEKSFD